MSGKRRDVRDELERLGWKRKERRAFMLTKNGALWGSVNNARDSGLDVPRKGTWTATVEFSADVPAPVIVAACEAAAAYVLPNGAS